MTATAHTHTHTHSCSADFSSHSSWAGLTSKEGDSTSQEAGEAYIEAAVHKAGGQAIGDAVLHQGALNHIEDRHSVHLQHITMLVHSLPKCTNVRRSLHLHYNRMLLHISLNCIHYRYRADLHGCVNHRIKQSTGSMWLPHASAAIHI